MLGDQINEDETYKSFYSLLKDMMWDDVYERCRINKESLVSYKFNGVSEKYEASSYRDRITSP